MAASAQGGRSWFWAQGLGCGVLVAAAAPLAVVLGVLFAPAMLAAIMVPPQNGGTRGGGTRGGGGATRRLGGVLMVYGLAAALPWLHVIWSAAQSWPGSLDLLASMRLVAACWGAQGGAWLMGELVPLVARQVLEAKVRARVNRLRDARSRLQEEWGLGGEGA